MIKTTIKGRGPIPRTTINDLIIAIFSIFLRCYKNVTIPSRVVIVWDKLEENRGEFELETHNINIDSGETKESITKTIIHEMWHYMEKINPWVVEHKKAYASENLFYEQVVGIAEQLKEMRLKIKKQGNLL